MALLCISVKQHRQVSQAGLWATGYTTSMKTAVSIPDEIFHAAEALARRGRKSRSRIFSEALQEYVARHSPDAVTQAMDRVCEQASGEDYALAAAAARRVLGRSEW